MNIGNTWNFLSLQDEKNSGLAQDEANEEEQYWW
jgi:hypothetical protein